MHIYRGRILLLLTQRLIYYLNHIPFKSPMSSKQLQQHSFKRLNIYLLPAPVSCNITHSLACISTNPCKQFPNTLEKFSSNCIYIHVTLSCFFYVTFTFSEITYFTDHTTNNFNCLFFFTTRTT